MVQAVAVDGQKIISPLWCRFLIYDDNLSRLIIDPEIGGPNERNLHADGWGRSPAEGGRTISCNKAQTTPGPTVARSPAWSPLSSMKRFISHKY